MPADKKDTSHLLLGIYKQLLACFGPQHWWPAQTRFEVIVGAILTQNTAWKNVEQALKALKAKKVLRPKPLYALTSRQLARLIKPAGYYNIKAKRLQSFLEFLFSQYQGSLSRMFKQDPLKLRAQLLEVKGIGPETADSILLYAGQKPLFVVDAYTRRILSRHQLIDSTASYAEIQAYFMDNLPHDTALFNEFHALIVCLGKDICKTKPRCSACPLRGL